MTEDQQRLDETIPGGRYLADDGKTFVNANGEPLDASKPEPKPAPKAKAEKDAA